MRQIREYERAAMVRLFDVARRDTGQSRRVADFLLAWHNAEENGGWDPTDFWGFDSAIANDMMTVLHLIGECHAYPGDSAIGFKAEIEAVWKLWREGRSG